MHQGILYIVAAICFIIAAINFPSNRINFTALGLLFWLLTYFVHSGRPVWPR